MNNIILSFDVGIVNLAYCLFTKENNNWKILDWDIIDISERDAIKCHCGAKPSFIHLDNYYCKTHCKKLEPIKKFEELYTELPEKCKCTFDHNGELCGRKSTYGTLLGKTLEVGAVGAVETTKPITLEKPNFSNETYCVTHAKQCYKKYESQNKLIEYKQKSVKKLDFDDVRLKLIQKLDAKKILLSANVVVIENQPSMKNPVMKSISNTIYTYFLIRGIVDHACNSSITAVKFMSPSNKLKLVTEGESKQLVALKGTDESKAYKLTKSLGIKYTREILTHLPDWINKFNMFKKKDDLADAFLQGAYYYTKNF